MKPLEVEFNGRSDQKAFKFRQLQRTAKAALYVKSLKSNETVETYEVITIVNREARTAVMGGVEVQFEAKEAFPSPESWGTDAWTYNTLEEAKARFYSL